MEWVDRPVTRPLPPPPTLASNISTISTDELWEGVPELMSEEVREGSFEGAKVSRERSMPAAMAASSLSMSLATAS